jgi:hypothetical protein
MNANMPRKANGIEEIAERSDGFIDCYVSTNSDEVGWILERCGYRQVQCLETKPVSEGDDYFSLSLYFRHGATDMEIECIDIPIEESMGRRKEIGFMPMSKFRVYTNGSPNASRILFPLMRGLDEQLQNMAFVNDTGSAVYTKLSASY